jgi:hypothetical protein
MVAPELPWAGRWGQCQRSCGYARLSFLSSWLGVCTRGTWSSGYRQIMLPSKILNRIVFLVNFFSLWIPNENRQLPFDKSSSLGDIVVHYPETLQAVLLFETLPIYRLEWAVPRLFSGIAHPCSTSSKSEVFNATLKVSFDSLAAINWFQWSLIGWYLLEAYIALHSLVTLCISHAPLAIK